MMTQMCPSDTQHDTTRLTRSSHPHLFNCHQHHLNHDTDMSDASKPPPPFNNNHYHHLTTRVQATNHDTNMSNTSKPPPPPQPRHQHVQTTITTSRAVQGYTAGMGLAYRTHTPEHRTLR